MNLHRWFRKHSLRLLAIRDTPEAIAGGIAIGIFFGFMPLFGLKTLSAIFLSWLTGSNILAAVLAGTLHDLILPLMPLIYRWEYDIGYLILSQPHHWPPSITKIQWGDRTWWEWFTFVFSDVGKPLMVGGAICSTPFAIASFFVSRVLVARHHRRRHAHAPESDLDAGL